MTAKEQLTTEQQEKLRKISDEIFNLVKEIFNAASEDDYNNNISDWLTQLKNLIQQHHEVGSKNVPGEDNEADILDNILSSKAEEILFEELITLFRFESNIMLSNQEASKALSSLLVTILRVFSEKILKDNNIRGFDSLDIKENEKQIRSVVVKLAGNLSSANRVFEEAATDESYDSLMNIWRDNFLFSKEENLIQYLTPSKRFQRAKEIAQAIHKLNSLELNANNPIKIRSQMIKALTIELKYIFRDIFNRDTFSKLLSIRYPSDVLRSDFPAKLKFILNDNDRLQDAYQSPESMLRRAEEIEAVIINNRSYFAGALRQDLRQVFELERGCIYSFFYNENFKIYPEVFFDIVIFKINRLSEDKGKKPFAWRYGRSNPDLDLNEKFSDLENFRVRNIGKTDQDMAAEHHEPDFDNKVIYVAVRQLYGFVEDEMVKSRQNRPSFFSRERKDHDREIRELKNLQKQIPEMQIRLEMEKGRITPIDAISKLQQLYFERRPWWFLRR